MRTRKIASLEIYNQEAYISAAMGFIDAVVSNHKLYDWSRYNQFRFVVLEMIKRRVERAYPNTRGAIYIELFVRDDMFEVSVRDKGVPEWVNMKYQKESITTDENDFLKFIIQKFVDQAGVEKLGKDGQRMYVCLKILNPLKFKAPEPYGEIEVLDRNITIKPVQTEQDAIEAIRCIYSAYGYSYAYEKLYYVDYFMRLIKNGDIMSFLAVNEHGQTAGHFALTFSELFEGMPEISTVVTRKEFRGMGLFGKFVDYSIEIAKERGLRALMGQPVGFHPVSQKAFLSGGFTATSLLFSYLPPDGQSEYDLDQERLDLFASVKMLDEAAECTIYPPTELKAFVDKIYTRAAYKHQICEEHGIAEDTKIRFEEISSQKMKRVIVREAGEDLEVLLKDVIKDSIRKKEEMIEFFLSMRTPSCEHGYTTAKECGFVFSGIIPGAKNDEYLVMQLLLQGKRRYDQLVTVGEFETLTKEIKHLTFTEKMEENDEL